jgi:hypothetical protein
VICKPCRDDDHVGCANPNCCCGHAGSPVRALTATERLAVVLGTEAGSVRLREVCDGG